MAVTWNFDYPKIAKESGFQLEQPVEGTLDWRAVGSIEIDRILTQQNFEKLDGIIEHLSEAPLVSLLSRSNILDSGITKYFTLSQFAIQFLLFCKKFLDETVQSLRESIGELQLENLRLTRLELESNKEILQLHKEIQKLKEINDIIYPCAMCSKNFISNEMLNIHISRKHSEETRMKNDKTLISTIKLELEIKRLKERLNDAEREIRNRKVVENKEIEDGGNSRKSDDDSARKQMKNMATGDSNYELKTIGVQSNNKKIISKDIGIQSNLMEEKEINENPSPTPTDSIQNEKIFNICNMLQEKIETLEKSNEKFSSNEDLLEKFDEKLHKIEKVFHEKQQKDVKLLHELMEKLKTDSAQNDNKDEMKFYFENTIKKLQQENLEKLNQCVEKVDSNYNETLKILQKEIESMNKSKNTTKKEVLNVKQIAQSPNAKRSLIPKSTKKILQSIRKTDFAKETSSDYSEDGSDDSDVVISVKNDYIKKVSSPKIEKSIVPPIETSSLALKNSSKKLYKHSLKQLGISNQTRTLTVQSLENISSKLTERRTELKGKYPNFYATRNRIKKLVNGICAHKKNSSINQNKNPAISTPFQSESSSSIFEEENNPKNAIHVVQIHGAEIGNFESVKENPKHAEKHLEVESMQFGNATEDFKMKLDKILSSPIKRISRTSEIIEVKEQKNKDDTELQRKPVPAPRKRVMFDFPTLEEHDDETDSSLAERFKGNLKSNEATKEKKYFYESSDSLV